MTRNPVGGILVATVTPFTRGGRRVELDWIPLHLSFLRQRQVDGLVVLGTTGEGPSLAMAERKAVIDTVLAHRGDFPLVVGTGCDALPETLELSRYALDAGADAVMVAAPHYFRPVSPRGLLDYYTAVLEALPPEGRLSLYNIPAYVGFELPDEVVAELTCRYGERLLGIKDSSGDVERTRRYMAAAPGLCVYAGSDSVIAEAYRVGAAGVVSAVANLYPQQVFAVRQAVKGGRDGAPEQEVVARLRTALHRYDTRAALKALLHRLAGLPRTFVRPPLRDLTPDEEEALVGAVAEMPPP